MISRDEMKKLYSILNQNTKLIELLNYAKSLNIDNYYIGAGCIAQTIWNYQIGNDINYGISDYDFVYYDNDLSEEVESKLRDKINSDLAHLNVRIDVKNQARVHLWYEKSFGFSIKPYFSVEGAIDTWPSTATSIGVRLENELIAYSPFGLEDMFSQIIRPNKIMITKEIYDMKCNKWKNKWNSLTIIEW